MSDDFGQLLQSMLLQVWTCLQRSSLDINTACMNAFVSALIKQVSPVCVPTLVKQASCLLFVDCSILVAAQCCYTASVCLSSASFIMASPSSHGGQLIGQTADPSSKHHVQLCTCSWPCTLLLATSARSPPYPALPCD